MPGTTLPPSETAGLNGPSGLFARVERLERGIRRDNQGKLPIEMIFSYSGLLAPNIESPPWYPRSGGFIVLVRVSLLESATTDHVIRVVVDGTTTQEFTLPTGERTVSETCGIPLSPISYVTVRTITVTDHDLAVQMTAT